MYKKTITVSSKEVMELIDITPQIKKETQYASLTDGICHLYTPHTTSGLTINEGADPAVRTDIIAALKEIVSFDLKYQHLEGNSPAHLLSSILGCSATVFIENNSLKLGTWQKIFFCEFDGPRTRKVHIRLLPGISG
ncbi:MAG: secondary thiamine-phosphate synthase enzyme YjbQ [Desulfobia sp.]